jgi:nitrite reductase (NO-forming)
MKKFLSIGMGLLLSACGQKDRSDSSNKSYGSPIATVSTDVNNDRENKGPLAFAPNLPNLVDADTIDVKFDVTHQIFQISKTVAYTAWMFGGSVPGPVLRIKEGQTVRFSMTDRSNDSMRNMTMQMNMMPMPHSVDFHAAMVNPEDKYRSIHVPLRNANGINAYDLWHGGNGCC